MKRGPSASVRNRPGSDPGPKMHLSTALLAMRSPLKHAPTTTLQTMSPDTDLTKRKELKAVLRYPAGAKDPAVDIDETARQNYCNRTYLNLAEIARINYYFLEERDQYICLKIDNNLLKFSINFGGNFLSTWLECNYEPAGLLDFYRNSMIEIDKNLRRSNVYLAALGLAAPHFVEISSQIKDFTLEIPNFARVGWNDSQLSPAENAEKIVSAIKDYSTRVPTEKSFSDFVASDEHASLYRQAQVLGLLLEGREKEANKVLDEVFKGNLKGETGLRYRLSDGRVLSGERLLYGWLIQQDNDDRGT